MSDQQPRYRLIVRGATAFGPAAEYELITDDLDVIRAETMIAREGTDPPGIGNRNLVTAYLKETPPETTP